MRITRDTLLKIMRDTVSQRSRVDRSILAIYLCGSLLRDDFLLGGTTDIDLVFIHTDFTGAEREIVHLSDEVHLDIAHHLHKNYRQTRNLRLHPWLGPTLFSCNIVYDPQHFMDFTQASVRGQFNRSDYVMQRARQQLDHARQIWSAFHTERPDAGVVEISQYLKAVEHAANSVACLTGAPLTERRFYLDFPKRAEAVDRHGLYPGLLGLVGAPNVNADELKNWLPAWQSAYESIPLESAPPRLHPDRKEYFRRAFLSILGGSQPQDVLWPLLRTWTQAALLLPDRPEVQSAYRAALQQLSLLDEGFMERIAALDAYLDTVEETLETWARDYGA